MPLTAWKYEERNRHSDRKMYLVNSRGLRDSCRIPVTNNSLNKTLAGRMLFIIVRVVNLPLDERGLFEILLCFASSYIPSLFEFLAACKGVICVLRMKTLLAINIRSRYIGQHSD